MIGGPSGKAVSGGTNDTDLYRCPVCDKPPVEQDGPDYVEHVLRCSRRSTVETEAAGLYDDFMAVQPAGLVAGRRRAWADLEPFYRALWRRMAERVLDRRRSVIQPPMP